MIKSLGREPVQQFTHSHKGIIMYDLRTALDSLEIPRLQYRPNLEPDLIREALLEYCDLSPAELLQDDCPYPLANCWDDPTLDNLALALKYLDQ